MDARIYSSVDELAKALVCQGESYVCIKRRATDDLTSAFLAKTNQLAQNGIQATIVCVDEGARQRYLGQLDTYPAIAHEQIVTMRNLCLDIISDKAVAEAIGRSDRLLDENEHDVLLEDMKVSGLKPRRLREMMKFFFKSMSENLDEEEGWLITSEEQTVFAILQENLDVRRALLPYELAGKAYNGIIKAGVAHDNHVILVDDYGTLSKSSQRLIEFLAPQYLIVSGVDVENHNAEEDYPYLEGFTQFTDTYPQALSISLECAFEQPLRTSTTHETPQHEFQFVADEIERRIQAGTRASDILVAAPNSTWQRNIAALLTQKGIRVNQGATPQKIKGNPRQAERNADIKRNTFLKLILNPDDLVALRSWLGFGDWLLRSDAFLELMAYAVENGQGIKEAIADLRKLSPQDRPTQIFSKFDTVLDELEKLQSACSDISIADAVRLFEEHGMPLDESMIESLGTDPLHADLQALAEDNINRPLVNFDTEALTLASYRQCHGAHTKLVFITGMVNGFLPSVDAWDDQFTIDHQNKARERDRRLFDDLESTAREEIVYSHFTQDRLENVDALKLQASRIFIKDTTRIAKVAPSEFLVQA